MELDTQGYNEYRAHLSAEGASYGEAPGYDTPANPKDPLMELLRQESWREFTASEVSRKDAVTRLKTYWDRYDLVPYEQDRLLLAEQVNLSTPLIRSRVNQARSSLYASLAMRPFFVAATDDDSAGAVATHAQAALAEQLEDADFENTFDQALLGSLVGTLGIMSFGVVYGNDGRLRLDSEPVDLRDLYLSPHNVRDLQQCTMIAHRYYEPLGWLRDQALMGVFDVQCVRNLGMMGVHHDDDGNSSARRLHDLRDGDTGSMESGMVELLNVYIKVRPSEGETSSMYRLVVSREPWQVLRADPWDDGFPFWPLRHQRSTSTVFAPSFAAILQDLQYGKDQLFSLSFEQNRMASAPLIEYDPLSPVGEQIDEMMDESPDRAVRLIPGMLLKSRPSQQSLKITAFQPPNMALAAQANEIDAMANTATIPMMPAQTYRSATEHRIVNNSVTALEAQMLKVVRADLTRAAEYVKRLYWKYVARPGLNGKKYLQHGTVAYPVDEASFMALSFTPAA